MQFIQWLVEHLPDYTFSERMPFLGGRGKYNSILFRKIVPILMKLAIALSSLFRSSAFTRTYVRFLFSGVSHIA